MGISPTHFASFPHHLTSFPHQSCFISPKKLLHFPNNLIQQIASFPPKKFSLPKHYFVSLCQKYMFFSSSQKCFRYSSSGGALSTVCQYFCSPKLLSLVQQLIQGFLRCRCSQLFSLFHQHCMLEMSRLLCPPLSIHHSRHR